MKRVLFYILFLALACIAKAQEDYQPFVVEGKTWVYPPDTNNFYTHDMTCTITGDTTINDVVYKKVMAKGPSGFGVTGEIVYLYWKQDPSYQSSYAYYGAIREKDKKVYFIPRGESSQYLIYDFGLSVGECYKGKGKEMQYLFDYHRHNFGYAICMEEKEGDEYLHDVSYMLSSIKTVEVSGQKRRCYFFSGDNNMVWIEGIGNIWGFLHAINPTIPWSQVCIQSSLACYENAIRVYGMDDFLLMSRDIKNSGLPRHSSYDFELDGICYKKTSGNEVSVTYKDLYDNKYSGLLKVPEKIVFEGESFDVTSIGDGAFYYCDAIDSVSLPQSIRSIGDYSFAYCRSLKSFKIPKSIKKMGDLCLNGCSNLTRVDIEDMAQWCSVAASRLVCAEIPQKAISLYLNGEKVSNLAIPDGISELKEGLFYDFTGISSVDVPGSVKRIHRKAFRYDIKEVTVGNGIKEIDYNAFAWKDLKMTLHSPAPPQMPNVPNDLLSINATLYVPAGSAEKYRAAEGWSKFESIVEMEATGISHVPAAGSNSEERLYDLQGRRLKAAPQRGMYIRNGRKYVVK